MVLPLHEKKKVEEKGGYEYAQICLSLHFFFFLKWYTRNLEQLLTLGMGTKRPKGQVSEHFFLWHFLCIPFVVFQCSCITNTSWLVLKTFFFFFLREKHLSGRLCLTEKLPSQLAVSTSFKVSAHLLSGFGRVTSVSRGLGDPTCEVWWSPSLAAEAGRSAQRPGARLPPRPRAHRRWWSG